MLKRIEYYPIMVELERLITHTFSNPELLTRALTHKSHSKEHNERLEFLGDSILGVVISEYLYQHFSTSPEGMLTRMKSSLVRGATLCELAKELNLPNFLILGSGERKSNGKHNPTILENTFEAVIGAVFLDAGFTKTKEVILTLYANRLQDISEHTRLKDNKSTLQELLQKHKLSLPEYTVEEMIGQDHNAIFKVHAQITSLQLSCICQGKTIKIAEQNCAGELLGRIEL